MDPVLRGVAIYLFLLVIFRVGGRRSLGRVTTFDFVLLLIVAEATQQALLGQDDSITNALLLVTTLVMVDVGFSLLKRRFVRLDRLIEGLPLVVVAEGEPLRDRMHRARIDDEDVMEAARELQGLERMEQIKYAVLERNGSITIVPKASS